MHEIQNQDHEEEILPISQQHQQRRKGNQYLFYFKNNYPMITIGPHYPLSILLIIIIIMISYFLSTFFLTQKSLLHLLIEIIASIFLLISFCFTALKNQGIAYQQEERQRNEKWCSICQINKVQGIVHCLECDICIKGYDHHCIWTGKCIGEGNIFEFQMFLLSILVWFLINYILLIF